MTRVSASGRAHRPACQGPRLTRGAAPAAGRESSHYLTVALLAPPRVVLRGETLPFIQLGPEAPAGLGPLPAFLIRSLRRPQIERSPTTHQCTTQVPPYPDQSFPGEVHRSDTGDPPSRRVRERTCRCREELLDRRGFRSQRQTRVIGHQEGSPRDRDHRVTGRALRVHLTAAHPFEVRKGGLAVGTGAKPRSCH
jgi:hypothetical protein